MNFRSKAIAGLLTGPAVSFTILFFSVDLVCFIFWRRNKRYDTFRGGEIGIGLEN